MVRVVKKEEPLSFMCDQEVACTGVSIETEAFSFKEAYIIIQQHGWKAFKGDLNDWQHACPHCYVDWCRRAGVDPYETSAETTYDEVRALYQEKGVDIRSDNWNPDVLEPAWYLEKRREEEKRAKKAKKARRRKRIRAFEEEIPYYDEYA